MKTKQLLIGAIALMMALPMSAVQTTWYVRSDSGNDTSGDGSLAKPWKTFTTAYGKAAVLSGDILDVSGTFTTDYGRSLGKSITIQGNDKATAIFDGTDGNATFKNFANMTNTGVTIVIENVTFKNYSNYKTTGATQGGVLSIQASGGGCNVTCRNVVFDNNASNAGGAIQIAYSNNLTLEDCYFLGNSAKDYTVTGTTTSGSGGAIYISTAANTSAVSVNRCLFDGNKSYGGSGAAILYQSAAVSGTASASLTITNSTFSGNTLMYNSATAPAVSDGILNLNPTGSGVDVKLINNTIAYNSSARTSSGATPGLYVRGLTNITTLINNILFSNFDTQAVPVSTSIGNATSILNKESRNNITDVPSGTYNWTTKTTNGATMASGNVSSIVNGSSIGQLGLAANASALADNGGATKTLAIISVNSAAINAGYATGAPAVDSRNVARVGTIDVGAYEGSIIAGAATATAFTTTYGTASAEQTFPITGRNLIANLIATAPTGFEVSNNGSSYGATAAFTNSGGTASGTLSVRLAANAGISGSYNTQNIVLSSTNCNAVNIVTAASGNVVIAKALTVTGAATANKVYDGTTTASVTGGSLVGVISPDVVDLVQAGDFDTKNVGTSKTITANCSISGAGAGNYTLSQPTLTARDITAISTPISTDSNLGNAATLPGTDVSVAAGKVLTVDYNTTVRSITVAPGAKLTLSNGLTATNGITLESDENGTATILQSGTLTGNVTAKQYLGSARNWYVSSPVSSAGAPATNVDYYYEYVEGGNNNDFATQPGSSSHYWKGIPNGTTMEVGKGYIAKTTAGTTVQFSGTPNNGDITTAFNLTRNDSKGKGFNLVGNPYPSYLDWVDVAAVNSNLDNSYYYRTKNSASGYTFVTWNGAGSNYVVSNGSLPVNTTVTRYIPPTQAFWVRVKSGTSSTAMNFTNAMREHRDDNGNLMKAKRQDTRTSVRLQLQNGTEADELLIYQDETASNNYDAFDSPKMMNNSSIVPDLYSKVGNERLVINGLNTITDNTEIPLGFSLNAAASLKLKATEMSNFPIGTRLYLLDKVESTQVELLPETEYSFKTTTATTNNESRFSLLFRAQGASTGIEKTEKGNTQVFVNAANQITIITPEKATYSIYNAVGQLIVTGIVNMKHETQNAKLNAGVYVVKVNNQSTRVIVK